MTERPGSRLAGALTTGALGLLAVRGLVSPSTDGHPAAGVPTGHLPGSPTVPPRPRVRQSSAVLWTVAALLLVAMAEISRLSGQQLDLSARSWSFEALMGPARLLDLGTEGWLALHELADSPTTTHPIGGWLTAYLLLDLGFIACYWYAARRALRVSYPSAVRLVTGVALADLAENLLALTLWRTAPEPAAPLLVAASFVKWALAAVLVLLLVRRLFARGDAGWREGVMRWVRAAYTQRFSVLPLVPLVAMSVLPGPDMLDQLPDIQRRWLGQGDVWHGVAAALALLVLAGSILLIGRMRADYAWWRVRGWGPAHPRPEPMVGFWLVCAGVILVLGLGLPLVTGTGGVSLVRLGIFAGVPLAIGLLSWWLRAVLRRPGDWPWRWLPGGLRRWLVRRAAWVPRHVARPDGQVLTLAHLQPVRLVGDVLATVVLVIGGAGLVRSFTAVVTLEPGQTAAWVALALGVLVAVAAWPLTEALYRWLDRAADANRPGVRGWWATTLRPGHDTSRRQVEAATALLLLSLVTLIVLGSVPVWAAAHLGVIASVVLALSCLTGLVATAIVLLQYGGSPHVFWLPGLRLTTAPVVSLLVITVLVASTAGGDARIHGVRSTPVAGDGMTSRATVADAFAGWVADPDACRVTTEVAGREVTLRPMVLLAAEGGGVRAAYWTAASLDLLEGRTLDPAGTWGPAPAGDGCGAASTLLSGGASGGAVGLVAGRFAGEEGAREQVERIAGPEGLGSGAVGLLVRDLVYGGTGMPLPVLGSPALVPDGQQWVDRAGLMELVWQDRTGALAQPFLPADAPPVAGRASGHLVLTSTSMTSGCRMLVSQLDLTTEPVPGVTPTPGQCNELGPAAANSVDLLGVHRGTGEGCLGEVTAATAGMLTARFPYVTPSGVVDACGTGEDALPRQQLVDGGYTENTGLGTIVDLSPHWLPLVQEHNTAQLAEPAPEVVVPMVVYLDNGSGSDLAAPTRDLTNELLVPPVGDQRAGFAQADTPALLQRSAALIDTAQLWSADEQSADLAEALAAEVERVRPRGVVVVHQSTFPAVTAPLGWVLSPESMESMDQALARQLRRCDPAAPQDVLCGRGFGSLGDALAVLTPTSP